MLGSFQSLQLRLEVQASQMAIARALLDPHQFRHWLAPQQFSPHLGDRLTPGTDYRSWLGMISVQHHVEQVDTQHLRLLLSGGVDGFHDWRWGEGWVQSRLEGISSLPLRLGHSWSLWRLQQFLQHSS